MDFLTNLDSETLKAELLAFLELGDDEFDISSIQEDLRNGKLAKHIRECNPNSSLYYGIMVAIPEYRDPADEYENPTPLDTNTGWKLEIIIPCRQGERKRSITEMLFYMLRSGH